MAVLEAILEAGHGGSITVSEGAPHFAAIDVPAVALPSTGLASGLQTAINAAPALLGTYTVTLNANRTLTIARTDGGNTFSLDVSAAARSLLGFSSSSYGAATSHTSETRVAFMVGALACELSAPQSAQDVRSDVVRHGRVETSVWGVGRRWQVKAVFSDAVLPTSLAWLGTRLRVSPTADTTAIAVGNLDGSVSAVVLEATWRQVDIGMTEWTADLLEVA